MKTIKQIADELGISKQRVYRWIKANCINDVFHDAHQIMIDDAVENRIKQSLSKDTPHQKSHHESHQDTSNDVVIEALLKQLEIKDKQIEQLTAALEHTTASLQAAQALHAGTIKELTDEKRKADTDTTEPVRRDNETRTRLGKLFRRRT